ncbi:MAG: hypothetical protein KKG00_08280 [Bacteroidetes bacterium]|nr:hypothetical protein [Bacteroidota bacterium]
MLTTSIAEEVGPDTLRRPILEAALSQYLNVLKGNFVDFDSVNESAPMPDLDFLK